MNYAIDTDKGPIRVEPEIFYLFHDMRSELLTLREAAQAVVNSEEHRAAVLRCEASYQINSLAALLEK